MSALSPKIRLTRWDMTRIHDVHIKTDNHRSIPNPRLDLVCDPLHPVIVNIHCMNQIEPRRDVVVQILWSAEFSPYTSVYRGILFNESRFVRVPKECPMVHAGLVGDCAIVFVGIPGVNVRVEVDHTDWSVHFVYRVEDGKDLWV